MRQIALSDRKKLRGIPRRLRSLRRWSERFAGYFPTGITPEDRYWHVKIPVHIGLVEGRSASQGTRRECFQQMINACARLKQAKPAGCDVRVTCLIAIPDMFTSELCLYSSEEYFQSFLKTGESQYGKSEASANRSLAQELGLELPADFHEVGMVEECSYHYPHPTWGYKRERWYFGEVDPMQRIGT